ncbi:MAG TPA: enoyl-CoA hydratase-related protein, partial [Novosphingobium sp.]|nr:enoyl-CoA hydratase-related protein [Novosphingobium sp.]
MALDSPLLPFLATVADLSPVAGGWDGPLALIDLDSAPVEAELILPPCPVIGFGDPAHPLARRLDCLVEAPVGIEGLARQVLARPHAAAVVVGLLRLLPALDPQAGLEAESLAYAVLQGSAEHRDWIAAQPAGTASGAPGRVRVERQGEDLHIVLDNPAAQNAIDRAMRDALCEAFGLAAADPSIARILLAGEGRAFSLGAALEELGTTTDPATRHAIRARTPPARLAARCA